MKNEYGLDTDYFSKLIKREFGDISRFKPDEFARVCLRMAKTSDSNVINESEFASMTDLQKENDELRLALGIAESFPLKVRMECRKLIKSGNFSRDFISMLHDAANAALSKNPAQSLAELKAEAVIEAANALCIKGDSVKPVNYTILVNYANQLKEG